MAGIAGVDPRYLTLRQLVWMAQAKRRDDWAFRSSLLALTWNAHFKPRMSPADFDPTTQRGGRKAVVKVPAERAIRMLQRMVLARRRPHKGN